MRFTYLHIYLIRDQFAFTQIYDFSGESFTFSEATLSAFLSDFFFAKKWLKHLSYIDTLHLPPRPASISVEAPVRGRRSWERRLMTSTGPGRTQRDTPECRPRKPGEATEPQRDKWTHPLAFTNRNILWT